MNVKGSKTLTRICQEICDCQHIVVVSHKNPDGDALGSVLGLHLALKEMGKRSIAICSGSIPRQCEFLPNSSEIQKTPPPQQPDAVFILDCDGSHRIAAPANFISNSKLIINIDHHPMNPSFGHINWIDPKASSVGEMIYRLLKKLTITITPNIAQCLYSAIATDTGTFRFENTSSRSLKIASELVGNGADPALTAQEFFESRPANSTKLMGLALSSLKFDRRNKISWAVITKEDFRKTKTTDEDTEGIVNFVRSIKGAQVGVLFRELTNKVIRISLRSSERNINVRDIALDFGGGGHLNAAGCTVKGDLNESEKKVIHYVRRHLKNNETAT